MRLKPHILTVARTPTLRQIAEDFEIISSARRCQPEDLLGDLGEPETKQVYEAAGVESRGGRMP